MRVLVIGSGGREHALCLALAADPAVTSLVCAPGNAGTAAVAEQRGVDPNDGAAVSALATELGAELVVIGPEAPLVAGVADAVRAAGIDCFGPSAAAARLEGSKTFAKEVMAAAGIPTAASRSCTTPDEVADALDEFGPPYVVKDDGLAAGKGVVVTSDRAAALAHAKGCERVVVEEFLDGPEASLFCVTDGVAVVPLVPAQDFKRIGDGDTGPNTGGMGAYAPLPWLQDTAEIVAMVAQPAVDEMRRRGTPFAGLLYIGLALTSAGPRVVEFNARFGDPETQVVLALLDSPLGGLLRAAATGTLARHPEIRWQLRADDLNDLHARQVQLLKNALANLAPQGKLIYSTCSLEPEENELVVNEALGGRQGEFCVVSPGGALQRILREGVTPESLIDADGFFRTCTSIHGTDGFFAAAIEHKAKKI